MRREQIARELLRVANQLTAGKKWYGYNSMQQDAAEELMTPDLKKLESVAKRVISALGKEYGVKLKTSGYTTHLPTPRAEVAIYYEGSIAKLLSVASTYKRPDSEYSSTFTHTGYELKLYAQRATGDANPYIGDKSSSPFTAGKVTKAVEKMKEKLGDAKFYKMMGIDPDDVGDVKADVKSVKKAIGRTWFDVEEESSNSLLLTTRENGDVGYEEPGSEDIREAKRIKKELMNEFGSKNVSVSMEAVDEWVHIDVRIK